MLAVAILTGSERAGRHCPSVLDLSFPSAVAPRPEEDALSTLDAMAALACQTRSVVHVVVQRQPGMAEHARSAARRAGVAVAIDMMPFTIRARFSP